MRRTDSMFLKRAFMCLTASILSCSSIVVHADAAGQWRDGHQVYEKTCGYCHDTGIGPEILGRKLPDEYVSHIVRNGFRAMPAFRAAEIDDAALMKLSRYVNSTASTAKQEK